MARADLVEQARGGAALLGLAGPRDAVRVTGGAGGTAAIVEDVDVLAGQLAAHGAHVDVVGIGALLVAAALDVQTLALLAPVEASRAQQACLTASARLGVAVGHLDALVAAARLAAQAYAGTEAAVTSSWHLLTRTSTGPVTLLLAVSAGLHEGLGIDTLGGIEAQALQAGADGWAQRLDGGRGLDSRLPAPTATDVVTPSDLSVLTARAAALAPRTGVDLVPVTGPPPATPKPGIHGLVSGLVDTRSDDGPAITVRRRTLDGPDGHREAYVVDLPGTQEWTPPGRTGTTTLDLASGLTQLGGGPDDAYVEACLRVLDDAPPGATLVLVGHSLGGITASTVAAIAATRGRKVDHVVAAGSPVDTMRVPRGTTVLSLQNDADLVPSLDGMPARDTAGRTTVAVLDDRGSAGTNHALPVYVDAAARADDLARTDPGLGATLAAMRRDGAVVGPRDAVTEEVVRVRPLRRP